MMGKEYLQHREKGARRSYPSISPIIVEVAIVRGSNGHEFARSGSGSRLVQSAGHSVYNVELAEKDDAVGIKRTES
jgi:hypothetical protein